MEFADILEQTIALLQHQGRISYGALKRRFGLDDAYLDDLKIELIEAQQLARDENGRILVWVGPSAPASPPVVEPALSPALVAPQGEFPRGESHTPEAERRQLTVLFCDQVDSTVLAGQLDPEDLREVIRAYQAACATVIEPLEGHIAQYLGDGLLVYFGYPQAHEDDAQRAARAGLGMVAAVQALNTQLAQRHGVRIAVRIGIHTGVVVVGEMGGGSRQEQLALGDTPNMAARLQGLAAPDTVVLSAATFRLVQGYFTYQDLGVHTLRGVSASVRVYRILGESGVQSRLEATVPSRLTPLVGREEEVALLQQRWEQAKAGQGQVILLSGEAGIGKSRLVQVLKDHVAHEPHTRIEWRGSSYHQQSALYPVIAHLHRLLQWREDEALQEKLHKLETTLAASGLALPEVVPLLAALLSLPLPANYPALTLTPQLQRQKTLETLLTWLYAEAKRQPVLVIVEDLHWIDPSTLELLSLLIDQMVSTRLCLMLTARPEFRSPWTMVAHLTALTLRRFAPAQVTRLASHVAGDKALPSAVLEEVVRKTDGVPLFVEELTKVVLESGLLQKHEDRYDLMGPLPPLAIPTTLHDALMARLDRLAAAKLVAQLGAVIGRTFAYDLVQAVAPLDATILQGALAQLVEAELVAQRGLPPQATYTFKHALVQDAAYQSLLRSTRQQYHQRIAQVLAERFAEIVETQPELLAHHYTEAGLHEQAISDWQRAGQQALQRSANSEAVQHLRMGLELLAMLPETPTRAQQELDLQITLGPALIAAKGMAAPEVEQTYARARALCQQLGETPQLFPTLRGLCWFYFTRGELLMARELGEQLYRLAQHQTEPTHLLEAQDALGGTLYFQGEYATAWKHLEQGIALTNPMAQRDLMLRYGVAPGVWRLAVGANALWCLGYPVQAVRRGQEAVSLAQALAHPHSLAVAQYFLTDLHHRRREASVVQSLADALLALATAQGFPLHIGYGTFWGGWALGVQGQVETGRAQMHQGMAAIMAIGQALSRPPRLALLAEAAGHAGQVAEGLRLLAKALAAFEASGRGDMLTEAHRLQGELLLRQPAPDAAQAEACFQQALAIAQRQQARSWELRAAVSLARLWQQQGRSAEARELLAPVYGWFTEGFDTADLQEAKALLEALA
jgi:class 3 adenylate cyclase/predicted ATPase